MANSSRWYSDPEWLVTVLRRTHMHWGQLPEIPGCDQVMEIRRGGQGVVYRARQVSTNRTVAIKVLLEGHFASDASRFRFQREIEFVARLRHPHIVRVHDSGVTPEGFPYYVMEYVEGFPVDTPDLGHVGNLKKTLVLFRKICDAVQHAHQHGIIHRDLKPGNILIDGSGSPHILDFGIAKIAADASGVDHDIATVSRTGQFLGSLAWASPEQIEGPPERVDLRADVYSLGVILYQLVTGRLPHEISKNLRQTLNEISTHDPPRPRTLRRDIPGDVETILLKCLAKAPERRYQTVGELGRDIQHYLKGEPIDAKRDNTWYVLQKALTRHKAVTSLAGILLVLVLGFAATMTVLYRRASDAELSARENLNRAEEVQVYLQEMIASADPCISPKTSRAIREIVDRAALNLGDRFGSHPEIEGQIRYVIGDAYRHLGHWEEADEHLSKALDLLESVHGRTHMEVAKVLCILAPIRTGQRRFDEAEEMLQRSMAIRKDRVGEEHVLSAQCLLYLGELRMTQYRTDEALALFQRAYEIHGKHPGVDNLYKLKTLIGWANLLLAVRNFDEGEKKLEEAQRILDENPKENAWARSTVLLHRGRVKLNQSDFDSAESIFREAVEVGEEVYGRTHTHLTDIFNLMGHTFYYQEQNIEAEKWYRKSLAVHEAQRVPSVNGRARCLWNIAHALWAQDDSTGGEATFREAVDLLRDEDGADQDMLAACLGRLGILKGQMEKWDEALPLFEENARLKRTNHGEEHYLTARANALLGECMVELGRYEEGESLLLGAYEILSESEYARSHQVLHTLTSLVRLYTKWEKPEKVNKYRALLITRNESARNVQE